MLDLVSNEQFVRSVAETNEHVLAGITHRISGLVVDSINNGNGSGDRKTSVRLAGFYIDFVHRLSSKVISDTPITTETIETLILITAEKKDVDLLMSVVSPNQGTSEGRETGNNKTPDNGLGKVIRKAESLIIAMPFRTETQSDRTKFVSMAGQIYDFAHEAQKTIDSGDTLDQTKIYVGGHIGKKPAALRMFMDEVFGKYPPVRLVNNGKVNLISRTVFPELFLLHNMESTNVAIESQHSYYILGTGQLPRGYDYQPEMGGLR